MNGREWRRRATVRERDDNYANGKTICRLRLRITLALLRVMIRYDSMPARQLCEQR